MDRGTVEEHGGMGELAALGVGLAVVQGAIVAAAASVYAGLVPAQRGVGRLRRTLERVLRWPSAEAWRLAQVVVGMGRVPGLEAALVAGRVSLAHAVVLVRTDPRLEGSLGELVSLAEAVTVAELEDRVRALTAALDEQDPAGRRVRQRERTGVARRSEPDGMSVIRVTLPDADASQVLGTAEAIADAAWRRSNPEGHEREPSPDGYAQRLADAFVEMAKLAREGGGTDGAGLGGAPAVVVVVDATRLDSVTRGVGSGGGAVALPAAGGGRTRFGVADTGGRCHGEQGAVPIGDVERLLCHAAISLGLADSGGDVVNLGRAVRAATSRQKLALVARDGPTCAVPGCTVPWRRTQAHHVLGWTGRLQGRTDLRELVHLCVGHHHDVHEGGWSLRWHLGSWQVYPPGVTPPAQASLLAHGKPRLGGPALGQAVA